ncbi:MAG: orotate phosphoribosyltransferase [Selenomonadaceae bacterium]|nr:orotate phosphoribosyltransferase [Selenomonadaceae bacterium]
MTEPEVMDLLKQTGAVLDGHFLLTSGLHSPHYVEKFNVLQHPRYTEKLCRAMAEKFRSTFPAEKIETVVGPVTGGILLAHEVGKSLNTRAIFTERVDGKMTFRRGFTLHEGEKVLIVEDIVTTGGSIKEVIDVVKSLKAIPAAVAMIVDRSGGKIDFGDIPHISLLKMNVETYKPDECPLCAKNIPITKRGSTGKRDA